MSSPVFLLGTQRSGTTLLCRMLSAHPEVFIKNEVPVRSVFTPSADRDAIVAAIDHYVQRDYGMTIAALLAAEDKSVWGLKDPELTGYLDALEQFLPEARFIVIVRDPRAVVRSYMENAWGLGTNAYTGALRWRREVEAQLAFAKRHTGQVLVVCYESLVAAPEDTLRAVCAHIGVSYSEKMLGYAEGKAYVEQKRESRHTFKAPDPALATQWQSGLKRHETKIINTVCAELMDQLGYARLDVYQGLPAWVRGYYHLHQKVIGELQIQYRWRVGRYRRALRQWLVNTRARVVR